MPPITFRNQFDETLNGTLHRPAAAIGFGFVLGHCFTCSRHTRILIDLSNRLAELGFSILRFDFSGNGQSQGRFEESTYTKQVGEMMTAIDFMKQNEADRILIGGHSMGGMVSLFTAAKRKDIAGVIALATGASPLHPDRLLNDDQKGTLLEAGRIGFSSRGRELVLTKAFFDDAAQYNVKEVISGIQCPALFVLASNDDITDPEPVKSILNGLPHIDLFEVAGADHMFSNAASRQAVMDYISQWIGNHFSEGS